MTKEEEEERKKERKAQVKSKVQRAAYRRIKRGKRGHDSRGIFATVNAAAAAAVPAVSTVITRGVGANMHFAHANAFQPLAEQPTADKELHHNALMLMLQENGMWNSELQQKLEHVATRIRAEQLAQTCQGLVQQQQDEGYVKAPNFTTALEEY